MLSSQRFSTRRVATRLVFCGDVSFSGPSVPRPVVILARTPVVPLSSVYCYLVLGALNTPWNGNLWYFALSRELIYWLKIHQKAGICI